MSAPSASPSLPKVQLLNCELRFECGGCPLHESGRGQEEYQKRQQVQTALAHWQPLPLTRYVDPSWGRPYRNRIRLRVDQGRVIFFNQKKDPECAVLLPSLKEALSQVQWAAQKEPELFRRLSHLEVRAPDLDGKAGLHLSLKEERVLAGSELEGLQARLPMFAIGASYFEPNSKRSQLPPQPLPFQRWQAARGYQYISVAEFMQVNTTTSLLLAESIASYVESLQLPSGAILWDLYAGSGNLSLPIAHLLPAARLTVVERTREAAAAALRAAKEQGLFVQAVTADATHFAESERATPTLLLVNPPRAGLREMNQQLQRWLPPHLIYVSCNPTSLAFDLQQDWAKHYRLVDVQLYNMFPHTRHVETLTFLERLK